MTGEEDGSLKERGGAFYCIKISPPQDTMRADGRGMSDRREGNEAATRDRTAQKEGKSLKRGDGPSHKSWKDFSLIFNYSD